MNNTIFDDVFRTMIEKMPYLAVPLINEVFHTSYSEDVKKTIMLTIGGCIAFIALSEALPLFFQ